MDHLQRDSRADEGKRRREDAVPVSTLVGGKGHVACRELANALGLPIEWDAATRTITIG